MAAISAKEIQVGPATESIEAKRSARLGIISFAFMVLQSLCTAVIAISGVRLAIGLGSLAAASIPTLAIALHQDAIRLPMMLFAVVGSVINLYVVWRIRSLRARPASQWRAQPVTAKQNRAEHWQVGMAVATLVLVVAELVGHRVLHGAYL